MTRTVVFSDLHGSWDALEALKTRYENDFWICLGDVLGGKEANRCLDLLASRSVPCVKGNHEVDLWSTYVPAVSPELAVWIEKWPLKLTEDETLLCHAWLEPVRSGFRFQAVTTVHDAESMFTCESFQRAFVGHSHQPGWWEKRQGPAVWTSAETGIRLEWKRGSRYIVDVGSLGEPLLPGDPRWVSWDERGVTWCSFNSPHLLMS